MPVKSVTLSATASFENPLVNPLYCRRKHRYIYGMGVCPDALDRGQVRRGADDSRAGEGMWQVKAEAGDGRWQVKAEAGEGR